VTLEEAVRSRRSVRRFTDDRVPRESILRLLDLARWAPHAAQCQRFVVVREPERKERLAEAARQEWIASAPVIIVVGADLGELPEMAWRWDAAHWRDLFPIQDTAAAIQTLMLAAAAEGLGTCWIGSFNEGDTSRVVQFPSQVRPVALVPLGHPADEPPKRTRRPLEEVAFWETFQRDGQ
jgi:nitroreductase